MKYVTIPKISKEEAELILPKLSERDLPRILTALAQIDDIAWVQAKYFEFIDHPDDYCAGAAIVGLGHLARISGSIIDRAKVEFVLDQLAERRPNLAGRVGDAKDDFDVYLKSED